eukprot:13030945-Alexandrium_andersonii.AAC.1
MLNAHHVTASPTRSGSAIAVRLGGCERSFFATSNYAGDVSVHSPVFESSSSSLHGLPALWA